MQASRRKRLFDLTVAVLGAVVWVPVLVLCALSILILEGRPVFYASSRRVGQRVIQMVKFRTMVRDAEKIYNRQTVPVSNSVRFLNTPPDCPLYTRIGRLIESLALTEIPQFLHVLKGDMSIVGNRPLPENVIAALAEHFPGLHNRFLTPAGMAGPVQLIGRDELSDGDRLMLESTYCSVAATHYAWGMDFMILWQTVLISLRLKPAFSVEEVRRRLTKYAHGREDVLAVERRRMHAREQGTSWRGERRRAYAQGQGHISA